MMTSWRMQPQTQLLVDAFARAGAPLRFVGGCVRDGLLGRYTHDVDAATPWLPEAVLDVLAQAGIRAVPTGLSHGTVTAVIDKQSFEITTLRRDVACDGRHAQVAFTDDWKADAVRRDFTMNALYLSPQGELFDYFGGTEDAQAGRVRFIGEPGARIREDYLRILRFFRFSAWVGKGESDARALSACRELAGGMDGLSGERLQQELLKLLAAPAPFDTLQLMADLAVLPHALGFEVTDCQLFSRFTALEQAGFAALPPAMKLAGFLFAANDREQALARLSQRLKLPGKTVTGLKFLLAHWQELPADAPEAMQKRLLRRFGKERFVWLVVLNAARGTAKRKHHDRSPLILAEHWQPPQFPITGHDILALSIAQGRQLGLMLRQLEDKWEASDYQLSREQLLATLGS